MPLRLTSTGGRACSLPCKILLNRFAPIAVLRARDVLVSVDLLELSLLVGLGVSSSAIKTKRIKDGAVHHAVARVWSAPVRSDDAEAQLQRIGHGGHPLGTTGVLADNDRVGPVRDVPPDPFCKQRLGHEVVHGALEEALHLAGVQVHGDDMVDTGNVHEVGQHAGSDGTSVALLLRLARVWEVRDDGWPRG